MTGKIAGVNLDNGVITTSVQPMLVAEKAANLLRVDVDPTNGIVQLSGIVDSAGEVSRSSLSGERCV